MVVRGLRTKIALNLAILFFVAMFLINLVTLMTAKREFIQKEVSRGYFLLSALDEELLNSLMFKKDHFATQSRAQVHRLLTESGVVSALVLGSNNERIFFGSNQKLLQAELVKRCQQAIESGKKEANFFAVAKRSTVCISMISPMADLSLIPSKVLSSSTSGN